jgi:zinc transport system substrate-binding protein
MKAMTARVATAIPGSEAGRDAYLAQLDELDGAFRDGLAECDSRILVSGHRAFAYLAAAYDLDAVSIAGISPSEEPSAQTLEDVATFAKDNGVTTIFFEENLPDDLARTVADEIGATTAVLDPIESPSGDQLDAGATYVSIMTDNLAALRAGLGCG